MSGMSKALCAAVSLMALAACQTNEPLLSAGGPTDWKRKDAAYGNYQLFRIAHDEAFRKAGGRPKPPPSTGGRAQTQEDKTTSSGDVVEQSLVEESEDSGDKPPETPEADAAREMLRTGFDLIDTVCTDFFAEAGRNQGRVNFSREIIVVGTGFVGSAMGLNPRNERSLVALPLLSSAAYGGIDAYNSAFLFGAENIDSVRDLTMKALAAQKAATLRDVEADDEVLTYTRALSLLRDYENVCMAPKILSLTQDAIKAGQVTAKGPSAPPELKPGEILLSKESAKALGTALGLPGPVSEQQAAALFWIYQLPELDLAQVTTWMSALPANAKPLTATGAIDPAWARKAAVEPLLAGLGDRDTARLTALVDKQKAVAKGKPADGGAPKTEVKEERKKIQLMVY